MKIKNQGFTLIELMIVVSMIGILASIAISAYQTYVIRSQISAGIVLSGGAKIAVTEHFESTGLFPVDNATAGIAVAADISGQYVTHVNVLADGVIQITYGNDVRGNVAGGLLTLTPTPGSGSVVWACAGDAVLENKFLPSVCRT